MKRCFLGSGTRHTDGLPCLLLVVALLLGAHSATVVAHALVIASQPEANAELTAGAVAVDLKFNSRLDRKRARLRLIDAAGTARDLDIEEDDRPDHLRAATGALAAGAYRIEWYVLSPDGHVTRGNVPFTVHGQGSFDGHMP